MEYCLFKERCQSHSIPVVLDVHSQTSLAVIESIQASMEYQCSYWMQQRGAQVVLIITSQCIEFHLFYTDGKRRGWTMYWSYCRHNSPTGGPLLAVQTRGPYYTALVSLLLCDARWVHLGEWNAACSGLLKGVVMLRHLKWQEPGRYFCQTKTLVLTWSYNWIILWYLFCHHKQRTLLYPYPKTSDPVSLYSVTQWSHICII